jgi:hypothetical protein
MLGAGLIDASHDCSDPAETYVTYFTSVRFRYQAECAALHDQIPLIAPVSTVLWQQQDEQRRLAA